MPDALPPPPGPIHPGEPSADPDDRGPRSKSATKAGDLGGKRLVGLDPEGWLRWTTDRPHVRCLEQLEGSFQWVGRETDVLLRALDPEVGEFLVLIELQTRTDPKMSRRIEAYAALAEEKFGLPVYPVVVNILDESVAGEGQYVSEILELRAERSYRVVHLRQQDAVAVLAADLVGLLPFLPIMRGGADLRLLRRAVTRLRRSARLAGLESLLAYMARHVLEEEQIMELMSLEEAILRDSPWYDDWISEGIATGALRQLLRALSFRFGPDAAELQAQLSACGAPMLEQLMDEALRAADLEAFQQRVAELVG